MDRDRPRLNRLPRWFAPAVAAVPVAFLAVFYVWPFVTLVVRGVGATAVGDVLGDGDTWRIAWFTLWQAALSTALTLLVGLLPAHVVARYRFPGRRLLVGLLTAAFVLPTVVMGAAMLALLPAGVERSVGAMVAAHVVFNLAVVVRTVGATWEHLPGELEAAAATLGASPLRAFVQVTLPAIRPALVAAASIVFVFCFTSFGVVRILGGPGRRTLEVEIWRQATQLGQVGPAAVLAVTQLVLLGAVVAWSAVGGRRAPVLELRPGRGGVVPRRPGQRALVGVTAVATALLVLLPLAALAWRSVRTADGVSLAAWRDLGRTEIRPGLSLGIDPVEAMLRSLRTAGWATLFAVSIGGLATAAASVAGRAGRVLDAGLMLPLGTSAVTIGFGMLITFDVPPVDWRAEWWLVPVGHALIAVPFVVRSCLGVVRGVDPALSHAAATLGATPLRAWRSVVLPHLWRPLAVGAGLAAAISLGEFGATSFLSRSGGETMPIAIEQLVGRAGTLPQAQGFALATILAVATVLVVAAVDRVGGVGARRR